MATKRNLYVDQGCTYDLDVDVVTANNSAFNLDNYEGRGSFRKHFLSANSVAIDVTVNAIGGFVSLSIPSTRTANIDGGKYVYDVEVYNGSTVYRVIEGMLFISSEVTK